MEKPQQCKYQYSVVIKIRSFSYKPIRKCCQRKMVIEK